MAEPTQMPRHIASLGAAIYHLRHVRGLTMRQLANAAGVSTPFVCDLEKDRRTTMRLDLFAKALDVPRETLARYDIHRKQFTRADIDAAVEAERDLCADLLDPRRWEGHPATRDEALTITQAAIRARSSNGGEGVSK